MTEDIKSWFRNNSGLFYFLIAQAVAVAGAGLTFSTYMTRLEARVNTLEVRGSPHLSTIDNRLTVLESQTKENRERIERVVDIMTREMGKDGPMTPDTPVYVEWWSHKRIPSRHYACVVPYQEALQWFNQPAQPHVVMQCFTIDGDLLKEFSRDGTR